MGTSPLDLARLGVTELRQTSATTLRHYNQGAQSFWRGTRDHDVSQNIAALLRHLPGSGPQTILDLGCGPGRDLLTFRELGHEAIGLDGAEQFVRMAADISGCEVLCQDFLNLNLPAQRFDGIFANASLFHVPSQELARVLSTLRASLKPIGTVFCSNPHGPNREGWSGDRYCSYLDLDTYRRFMSEAGFVELEHFYRPPGKPRHQQPWLASVSSTTRRKSQCHFADPSARWRRCSSITYPNRLARRALPACRCASRITIGTSAE